RLPLLTRAVVLPSAVRHASQLIAANCPALHAPPPQLRSAAASAHPLPQSLPGLRDTRPCSPQTTDCHQSAGEWRCLTRVGTDAQGSAASDSERLLLPTGRAATIPHTAPLRPALA